MEDFKIYRLSLFSEPSYEYHVVLESRSYKLKFMFNTRMNKWTIGIGYSNGEDIVNGKILYPNYPIFVNRVDTLSGYFILVPIGKYDNETISNPYEIYKYYNFYYIEDDSLSNPDY